MLARCVPAALFFKNTLEECIPDLLNVFCSDEVHSCSENHAPAEQFRVIWEAGFRAAALSLSQINLFPIPSIDCRLIILVDRVALLQPLRPRLSAPPC